MRTQTLVAAALAAGQQVLLDKSKDRWVVESVANPTGLVMRVHLTHARSCLPSRVLHVFPDALITVVVQ